MMRENYRYRGVKGMNDVFPGEAERFRRIEDRARDHFARYGCGEIRTPLVEHTVLFERGVGEGTDIVNKEMFYVPAKDETDPAGAARRMVLRPEATASVVRAYVEHEIDKVSPGVQRYFYGGPMFRYERPQKGRLRQFHQIGVEWLGIAAPPGEGAAAEDAEVICLLWDLCRDLDLRELELQLNSVGCSACRPGFTRQLQAFAAEHADALCPDCNVRREKNPLRLFDCKVPGCREIMRAAPVIREHLCGVCEAHQDLVEEHLRAANVAFTPAPRLVRGLDYYTRTVFELVSRDLGAQNAVAAGGRYDNLVESLEGPPTPAVGWSLGVERIMALLPATDAGPGRDAVDVLVADSALDAKTAFAAIQAWRRQGIRVVWDKEQRSVKALMKKADKIGAAFALFVSAGDPARIQLKNLRTQAQDTHTWDDGAAVILRARAPRECGP